MKKSLIVFSAAFCVFLVNILPANAEEVRLSSGDYTIVVDRQTPAQMKTTDYAVHLLNTLTGEPLSGANISLEAFYTKSENHVIMTGLKEEDKKYLGTINFDKKGEWSISVLGTIVEEVPGYPGDSQSKPSMGTYPFRAAFNEPVGLAPPSYVSSQTGEDVDKQSVASQNNALEKQPKIDKSFILIIILVTLIITFSFLAFLFVKASKARQKAITS